MILSISSFIVVFASRSVQTFTILPEHCEGVFLDPSDCCSPLFGISERACGVFEAELVRECCVGEIRSKAWKEMMAKISRILHRRDLPSVIRNFVPSGFFTDPSLVYAFQDDDVEHVMSRLVLFTLALEWSLLKGDVSDELWILLDMKLFEFPWTMVPVEIPLFGVLHRLWEKARLRISVDSSCVPDLGVLETSDPEEVQLKLSQAPCIVPIFLALEVPVFSWLDSRNLPTLIRHQLSCDGETCAFARPVAIDREAGETTQTNGTFIIKIPQTREMPAEANRISGPFILPQTLLELGIWLHEISTHQVRNLTIVEVGAHYGDCSLFLKASLTGRDISSKFFIFEPQSEAASVLVDSIALNSWAYSMTAVNAAAVSEETFRSSGGFLNMSLVKGSSVHGAMEGRDPFGTPAHELYVDKTRTTTLDRELNGKNIESIDLLLLQTNGAEVEVLLGGRDIFLQRLVRKLILRTWLWAPYVDAEGREYRREEKWKILEQVLVEYGCRDIVRTILHESENSVTAYCD